MVESKELAELLFTQFEFPVATSFKPVIDADGTDAFPRLADCQSKSDECSVYSAFSAIFLIPLLTHLRPRIAAHHSLKISHNALAAILCAISPSQIPNMWARAGRSCRKGSGKPTVIRLNHVLIHANERNKWCCGRIRGEQKVESCGGVSHPCRIAGGSVHLSFLRIVSLHTTTFIAVPRHFGCW